MRARRHIALILTVLVLGPVSVAAHQGATGIVKDRMDQMKSVKDIMKVLAPMMKGQSPYDVAEVRRLAGQLSDRSGDHLTRLFPDGSISGPSEALPAIWQDWPRFVRLATEMEQGALALQANAALPRDGSATDPMKGFLQVVGTCRGCHDDFRKD